MSAVHRFGCVLVLCIAGTVFVAGSVPVAGATATGAARPAALAPGDAGRSSPSPAARLVGPRRNWTADDLERFDPSVIHLKLVEGSEARIEAGRFRDPARSDVGAVNAILDNASILDLGPTFPGDRAVMREWQARGEARSGMAGPDLSLWFDLRVEGGRSAVARVLNALNACSAVEIAHPEAIAETAVLRMDSAAPAPAVEGGARFTPDFTWRQDYLRDPPLGLDAPAAWAVEGGMGDGMRFIDVELAWTEDHEDFDFGRNFFIGGETQDPSYEPHGTAVLGEILGQQNLYGVNGFASRTEWGVEAINIGAWPTVPQYFQEAVDQLRPGDVWLIELQMYPPGRDATPMEWLQVNYDVIWTGVWSRGVVCVEAGANGAQDLDDSSWGGLFDREVRDSGAIMVGAGTPSGLMAEYFTNYGSRMDVHAWGEQITTTGYGDLYNGGTLETRYTASFSGTSGASPMVVGSCLCLQGARLANLGAPLDPIALRALLHDTGTPHHDPTKEIGPRPDLGAAIDAMLHAVNVDGAVPAAPGRLRLAAAPNPVTEGTTLRLRSEGSGTPLRTDLAVIDAAGRRIRVLRGSGWTGGEARFVWDGRDGSGRPVPGGVYFLRPTRGDRGTTCRVVVIR